MKILALLFLLPFISFSQSILPFSGMKVEGHGIYCKKVETRLNDSYWTSNRLPVETKFQIKLIKPKGFSLDTAGYYHPNIRLCITDMAGDTMALVEKFMGEDPMFQSGTMNHLSLTLSFNEGTELGKYRVQASFFDELYPASYDVDFVLELVESEELNTTDFLTSFTSDRGYELNASEVGLSNVLAELDTLTYGKMIYHEIKLLGVELTKAEIQQTGTYFIEGFDPEMNLLNESQMAREPNLTLIGRGPTTDVYIKMYLPLDTENAEDYFLRWRWESNDGKKIIDVVNTFK